MSLKVNGFVDKSETVEQILHAIREVMAGRSYFSESFSMMAGDVQEGDLALTRQQLAILAMLQDGCGNKEIARQLFISINTVKTHLRLLYEKLDVTNRTACIEKARKRGLI